MPRVARVELSPIETRALEQLRAATRELEVARRAHRDFTQVARDLGLPTRMIGEAAGVSAAHVSRTTRPKGA